MSKHYFQSLQIILAGKDILSFPQANGVTSRIIFMLNWEPGHEAAAGSAVKFTIGRPVISDLDQCASFSGPWMDENASRSLFIRERGMLG